MNWKFGWIASACALLGGCAASDEDLTPAVDSRDDALLGAVTFNASGGSDCGPYQDFVQRSVRRGRAIAASGAFTTCIRNAMAGRITLSGDPHAPGRVSTDLGPYHVCNDDPRPSDPVAAVLAFTRSGLDLAITCTSATGDGIAFTNLTRDPGTAERLTYREGRLLASVQSGDLNYTAATIWHEAMHQHGYDHGTGRAETCGYGATQFADNDDGWMTRHSVPYIVTSCMTYVGDISDACPATCRSDEVSLRSALSPTAPCVCVRDPGLPVWSSYVSEENSSPIASCPASPADGMGCAGRYCDNVALRCPRSGPVALSGGSYWTAPFSDETPAAMCNPGTYVTAVRCTGRYCDNLSLLCAAGTRPWSTCSWQTPFSEEQGTRLCPAGSVMAGARCSGDYCDNLSLLCCRPQ